MSFLILVVLILTGVVDSCWNFKLLHDCVSVLVDVIVIRDWLKASTTVNLGSETRQSRHPDGGDTNSNHVSDSTIHGPYIRTNIPPSRQTITPVSSKCRQDECIMAQRIPHRTCV
jgi:hypothetical protein